jgi:hypothetical protein
MKVLVLIVTLAVTAGCASQKAYNQVFSERTAIVGNSHSFAAAPDDVLRAVIGTLVQRGFSIEQTDLKMGLIKATRNLQDPNHAKVSYLLSATASVWAPADGSGSVARLAASEQQVMHSSKHNWVPILGPLIIPMPGKTYQTTVTKEGTITDSEFYADFFAAVQQTLAGETVRSALTAAAAAGTPEQKPQATALPAQAQGSSRGVR